MKRLTRRDFLNAGSTLASAMVVNGANGLRLEASESNSPGDKIRVAVVGVNGRGMDHVRGYMEQSGATVTAICDADEAVIGKAMKAVEQKNGKTPKYYQDFRKLIEDKDIDAVSIATPNHWHALMAIWAMQHGKDVYVEKPVSHNVWEGRRIVETARETNRICQTGTQVRSQPGVRDAIKALHDGFIGKVDLAIGLCYKSRNSIGKVKVPLVVPASVNFDLWCGPAQNTPISRQRLHYDWHWFWNTGNGDLGNQGIHQMDVARWGLNQKVLAPSIFSIGGRIGYSDDGETANTHVSVFDYGTSTLIFEVRGLKTQPYKGATVGNVFVGERGYLVISGYNNCVFFDSQGHKLKEFKGGADHYANFLKAVRSRKHTDLNADILEGHLSSGLCHLGNISHRLGKSEILDGKITDLDGGRGMKDCLTRLQAHVQENKIDLSKTPLTVGRRLTLNPNTEKFEGDSQANAMLSREYRKGFEVPVKRS